MADVVDLGEARRAQRKVLWVKDGDIDQVVVCARTCSTSPW
jgi:hypothetical protein